MADCMNSSPPLIFHSRKFQGFGGIWANSGKSGKFRKIQGNSVEFCVALNMNSVGVPGGFRGDAGFWKICGFGWFRAIWGLKKAFAQIAT